MRGGGGGEGAEPRRGPSEKQEPHTVMWGKIGGAQANQVFLVANLLNSKEFLESVDSNCVLDSGFATFWIFPFGSHVVFYV